MLIEETQSIFVSPFEIQKVFVYLEDLRTYVGFELLVILDFAVDFGLQNYERKWDLARIFIGYANHACIGDLRMRQ
jgi:hypothetical protein